MAEMQISRNTATCIFFWVITPLIIISQFANQKAVERVPARSTLWQQFTLSLPSSLQQLFFAAGLVTLTWIVSRIGTAEVAAVNVLMTFHLTAMLPSFGIALACTTLVGNALGRKDGDDAACWGWNCAVLTFIYGSILTVAVWHHSEGGVAMKPFVSAVPPW